MRAARDKVAGMTSSNPLLTMSDLPYHLPRFADITSADYEEAIMAGMDRQRADIAAIAAEEAEPTFDNTLVAIERTGAALRYAVEAFYLKQGADTTPELDAIDERIAPLLAAHNDAIHLDAALFARVDALYRDRDSLGLDPAEAWLLDRYHTRFVRAGAHLGADEQDQLRAINAELASLTTEFGNRVRAATKAAMIDVHDEALLDGLSGDAIAAARAAAEGREAPYTLSFILPTAQPALASLTDRALREQIFRASVGRGTSGGDTDTTALIPQIAALRARRAALFGYPNHAAYVIADNTARTVDAVADMLGRLAPAAVANAATEAAALQAVIDADGGDFTLAAWDWAYYTERVRAAHYDIDENELRPYFELNRVLVDGVFFAATKLYGVTFAERADLVGYNDDVQIFEVFEAGGEPLGLVVADYVTRPSKSGGAWMESLITPNDVDGTRPVVTQNMNIGRAPAGQPTLMSLDEVRTMFHEFGHALHGLFGRARWPLFAGTSSPRDFVEYPSQVNELWKLWPEVLANYATHIETGEPLPQEIVDRLHASETFNEGFATCEYLAAALLDLAWHTLPPGEVVTDVEEFEAAALAKAGLAIDAIPPRYRSGYFAHVFSGGYSAGYYGYIWSEVLDADTVDWFHENGGLTRENGDTFRYRLLGACGSADPMEVYRAFRGRDPRIEPLLKRRGLVTA
jgi:peptidyl-dipeptidase Dcp